MRRKLSNAVPNAARVLSALCALVAADCAHAGRDASRIDMEARVAKALNASHTAGMQPSCHVSTRSDVSGGAACPSAAAGSKSADEFHAGVSRQATGGVTNNPVSH